MGNKNPAIRRPWLFFVLAVMVFPVFLHITTSVVVPGFFTFFLGKEGEMVVQFKDRESGRRCRNGMSFEGKPLFASKVCGLDPKFIDSLSKGDTVILTGTASRLGIFANQARKGE